MNKYAKKILGYLLLYLGITLLFSTLMVGTYILPNYNIRGHVAESLHKYKEKALDIVHFLHKVVLC